MSDTPDTQPEQGSTEPERVDIDEVARAVGMGQPQSRTVSDRDGQRSGGSGSVRPRSEDILVAVAIACIGAVAAIAGIGALSYWVAATVIADSDGAYNLIELNAALASGILGAAIVLVFLMAAHVVRHWNRP